MSFSLANTFASVEAMKAKPAVIRELMAIVLRNDACWAEIHPLLSPPGKGGNSQFDHCDAVNVLLKHDAEGDGMVNEYMVGNTVSKVQLWKILERTLRVAGFEMARGRVVGVLEDKSDRAAEADQVVSEESTHHAA